MGDVHTELDERIIDADTDDGPMAVLVKQPADDVQHPAVVFFHDGPGMRDATHVGARRLAGEGYVVIVPDLYHRHGRMIGFGPDEMAENPDARPTISRMLASLTDEGIQHDLDAALAAARVSEDAAMGCIGFCLGARAVFRTMMRLPEHFVAGAMFHPSFLVDDEPDSPHLTAAGLGGRLYIGMGEADRIMSVESTRPFLDAVSALGDSVRIDIHPGADHGYTWPDSPNYDEAAAEGAWAATLALFSDALG